MRDHEVLKIAVESGLVKEGACMIDGAFAAIEHGDMQDALYEFARLVEQATLDRAAKVCEEISDGYAKTESHRYPELKTDAETGASDCEYAIRALKTKDSTDKG